MKSNDITEITLKMIFDAGIISTNTILYSNTIPVKTAKINSDGFIIIDVEGETKLYPYPSGAARSIVNLSVNGWIFWKVNINNRLQDLSILRTMYIEMQQKKN